MTNVNENVERQEVGCSNLVVIGPRFHRETALVIHTVVADPVNMMFSVLKIPHSKAVWHTRGLVGQIRLLI